jgi:tetratricopeptide (TPR) repeat protein
MYEHIIISVMRTRQRNYLPWVFFIIVLFLPFIPAFLQHQTDREIRDARQAASDGEWQSAASKMAAVAARLPQRNDLWQEAGHYAWRAGDSLTALECFQRVAPGELSLEAQVDLGDIYEQTGDLEGAIRTWSAAWLSDGPAELLAPRLFGAYRQRDDLDATLGDLRILAERYPDQPQVLYQFGLMLLVRQPHEAGPYLRRAAELDNRYRLPVDRLLSAFREADAYGNPAFTALQIGRALAVMNEWFLASQAFRYATELQPGFAEGWAYLGQALSHISEGKEGLAEIERALQIDGTSVPANLFLAYYWTGQQRFDLAQQALQKAAERLPDQPLLHVELGNVLAQAGDLPGAHRAYMQAVWLSPNEPLYLHYLAQFSLRYNYALEQTALPAARQAVVLSPYDPEALALMAQVLIQLGDLASAERFLRRALQIDPIYAPVHLHLGVIFLLNNQMALARQQFEYTLQLAPDASTGQLARNFLERYFP